MSKLTPSRYPSRTSTNYDEIKHLLNDSLFCTISYSENDLPYSIPTGFCLFENQMVIHGSRKSHFLDSILKSKHVCITTFIFDGLVLATSAFEHSVNYRSAVLFSKAKELTNRNVKYNAFKAFTEKYVPGRWPTLRPMTPDEIDITRVLSFDLNTSTIKKREGPPSSKKDDWDDKVWRGVIPSHQFYNTPIPAPGQSEGISIPDHVDNIIQNSKIESAK